VPQRSVPGPLSFTLFINDICRVVRSSQYNVYADDFQLYAADDISNISFCLERVNSDLDTIYCWSFDNGLLLDSKKTQAMIICRVQGRLPFHVPAWRLNGDLVVYANKVRNLGMIVDSRLSFRDQANDIQGRVNFARSRLWHYYADITPVLTRKRLVQSLIVPYVLYCDVIYY
jgi:hypothetical protein